jgi:hypothetical protein
MANEHRRLCNECRGGEEGPILSDQRCGGADERAQSGQDIWFSIPRHENGSHPKLAFQCLDERCEVLDRPTLGCAAAARVYDNERLAGGVNMMGGKKWLSQGQFCIAQG